MIKENWQLITDEPVELTNNRQLVTDEPVELRILQFHSLGILFLLDSRF